MPAFSFARPFLRARREPARTPLRALADLGVPWTAPAAAEQPAQRPAPRPAPPQESIVELLRRLERGLAERAERQPEPVAPAPGEDVNSALRDALDTLQRMARQER